MSTTMFSSENNVVIKTALSSYNVFVHVLMGVTIAVPLLFAVVKNFSVPSPSEDIIMLHILLCVLGYQLVMPQAFLSLCPYNTWSSNLNRTVQTRVHVVLQLLGSGMAIAGSIIIMVYKDVNFTTTHGNLGLTALIFTLLNLLTGTAAFFAQPLSKFVPRYVPKLVHIILGIITFSCASACLCLGFDKDSFRTWTNDLVTTGVIAIAATFCCILLINPLVTLCKEVIDITKSIRNK